MMLKTERFVPEDVGNLKAYFIDPGENEAATWVIGFPELFDYMQSLAQGYHKAYAVRHQMISPGEKLSEQEWSRVLSLFLNEIDAPDGIEDRMAIVEHEKARADNTGGARIHRHFAMEENDPFSTRTLKAPNYMGNEFISRICELEFGHPSIPGRFNQYALRRLREERPDLDPTPLVEAIEEAAALVGVDPEKYCARSAYQDASFQAFKRVLKTRLDRASKAHLQGLLDQGTDEDTAQRALKDALPRIRSEVITETLPGLHARLREIVASCRQDIGALPAALDEAGFTLRQDAERGPEAPYFVDYRLPACPASGDPARTMKMGALDRLARLDRAQLSEALD
ncbi:hypothetical protein LR948_18135 [Roseivivax sp. GX 12232]|uniref:hypothetical protein n=1 Tax=Roseivivax sp. GX 12232 TaxID=2900547 RepID=UPI001E6276FC|nr:hypothetical protein [Roseivivax sp. GX 12232]MCE0507288.1 hypothetical protein [Roseivivax sp. GX 12232]